MKTSSTNDLTETVLKLAKLLCSDPEARESWKAYRAQEKAKHDAWFSRLPKEEQERLLAYQAKLEEK